MAENSTMTIEELKDCKLTVVFRTNGEDLTWLNTADMYLAWFAASDPTMWYDHNITEVEVSVDNGNKSWSYNDRDLCEEDFGLISDGLMPK